MSSTDTYVRVAPDSSGKKIRNLSVDLLQADGSVATVMMQVVSLATTDGRPVNLDNLELLNDILFELKRIRLGLQLLTDSELAGGDAKSA